MSVGAGRFVLATEPGFDFDRDWLAPEESLLPRLAAEAWAPPLQAARVSDDAAKLVRALRAPSAPGVSLLDRFLHEFGLDTQEGVLLMCLAEALLRIPDAGTVDVLIADKLGAGDWATHLGDGESLLVDASTWGLMLTGRLISPEAAGLPRLLGRLGEPVIRAALKQAMKILGQQFVLGRDIDEAVHRARASGPALRFSFDMLGEAALTARDATAYFESYRAAVARAAEASTGATRVRERSGISVKLSALHPRFEFGQAGRVRRELAPRLLDLVDAARTAGVPLTVDAEESDRLSLTVELVHAVLESDLTRGYEGFGVAVQAYQKRAPAVLDELVSSARRLDRRIAVRLVKGAYWDGEIKHAQERGLDGFPVYTRKWATDVAWLACARRLAGATDVVFPQFATHNAHSAAFVRALFAGRESSCEFQRLHGMGESLHAQLAPFATRVYAPVGAHRELLPYLVRRLLENGANTSFVHRSSDPAIRVEDLSGDPARHVGEAGKAQSRIRAPRAIHAPRFRDAAGINLASTVERREWQQSLDTVALGPAPAALPEDAGDDLFERGCAAFRAWEAAGVEHRAGVLEAAADRIEAARAELVATCVLEAGRTVPNALDEVRETADLLRYYAARARDLFADPTSLDGVAGESNVLRLRPRGVFACISPWNFPLSIFTGQLAAALAAGNTAIAKPAPQTPRCAAAVVRLLHEAGVPPDVLQLAPGGGELGAALTRHPRCAGVVFTGSTRAAGAIAAALAARGGPPAPLIAETGGINAILADSTALPEQLVRDVVTSAFDSAGQRCSAARLLIVQQELAPRVLELLGGAMDELVVGDPARLETDVGPVIDAAARERLVAWRGELRARVGERWWHETPLPADLRHGHWFAPIAAEIPWEALPREEVFGPVLHVLTYAAGEIDGVADRLNALGYGLTVGLQTRLTRRAEELASRLRIGNVYVNRNIIGAVVGSQPFGGVGLSGTGPKAGGPDYLRRFAWEQTVTVNTAAIGGNASLLAQGSR